MREGLDFHMFGMDGNLCFFVCNTLFLFEMHLLSISVYY